MRSDLIIALVGASLWIAPLRAAGQSITTAAESVQPVGTADLSLEEDGNKVNLQSVTRLQDAGLIIVLLDASSFAPQSAGQGAAPNASTEPIVRTVRGVFRHLSDQGKMAVYTTDFQLRVASEFGASPARDDAERAAKIFERPVIPSASKVEFHGLATFELQELESIANHVAAEPGRKALVWLCEAVGFSAPPREGPLYSLWFDAVSAAQRAGLAVYSVPCLAGSPAFRNELSNFSKLTGGRFYSGGYSNLARAIADARGDNLSAYSVAWDKQPVQNSSLHSLSLRAANASVKLLVPSALVEPMLPRRQDLRLKAAESALATPLAAKAIRISAALEARTPSQVEVSVTFDAHDLSLENPDRKLGGLLDFLFVFNNSAGDRLLPGQRSEMALNLQETEKREFLQEPHALHQKLEVPANAATLRVVVRDANSGRIGSVSVRLP